MSKEEAENMWDSRLRYPTSVPENVSAVQKKLEDRVERVLGCEVAITPSGELYLVEDDPRVIRWIQELREFDVEREGRGLDRLSGFERLVFEQVRFPNAEADLYAFLDGARGRRRGEPWNKRMAVSCLANGLGITPGVFIRTLKSVAEFLAQS